MRSETKKRKPKKENLIFAFSLIVIIAVASVPTYYEAEQKFKYEDEISEIARQAADAAKYNNELKNRIKNSDEDEYVEKVAREKLNMVKADEILYIDKNK